MSSSYVPLLSPPSRSFRTQLRYADFSSSLLQQQQMASVDALHGVMPLLQVLAASLYLTALPALPALCFHLGFALHRLIWLSA